jgi:molybdenum cofactor cytidylyltransferase
VKRIAAVILVDGTCALGGQLKQPADREGFQLLVHAARTAWRAGLDPVIAVLGSHAREICAAPQDTPLPVQCVMNWQYEQNRCTSVYAGLVALPPTADAVMFLDGDHRSLTSELLRRLVARFKETRATVACPILDQQRLAGPVLFARPLFGRPAHFIGNGSQHVQSDRGLGTIATVEAGGARLGLTTVLVLSGVAAAADIGDSPVQPDLVITGIEDLTASWRKAVRWKDRPRDPA